MTAHQPSWKLAAYALPYGPIVAGNTAILIYLAPLYAIDRGLGLTLVGTILFATRMADVVLDGAAGLVSDRIQTRWPRRKFWLAVGLPLFMLGAWQMLHPPVDAGGGWLFAWLLVFYVGYSFMLINHMAWGAEIADGYHERSRVQSWAHLIFILFLIATLALPAYLEQSGETGNVAKANAIAWLIVGAALPFTSLALWLSPNGKSGSAQAPGLWRAVSAVWQNRPFRRLLLVDLLSAFLGGGVAALYILFLSWVLGMRDHASAALLLYFTFGVLGIPLWLSVSKRIGKRAALQILFLVSAGGHALFLFIPPAALPLAFSVMALVGLTFAGGGMLIRSMIADTLELEANREEGGQAGVFYAAYNLVNKLGVALPPILLLPLVELAGFGKDGAIADASTLAFRLIFALPPLILGIGCALILANYPLSEERLTALREGRP